MTTPRSADGPRRAVLTDAVARALAPCRGARHPVLAGTGTDPALRVACGIAIWLLDDALAHAGGRPRLEGGLVPYLVEARGVLADALRPAG